MHFPMNKKTFQIVTNGIENEFNHNKIQGGLN